MFTNKKLPFLLATAANQAHILLLHAARRATLLAVIFLASPLLDACSTPASERVSTPIAKQNRLIHETSPYLLEHAHDPVDWYPWGEEAFKKAKTENKPILLSIGYSACHWCHVMQRESFQDQDTARLMNEGFISIKVDREERPDVDDIYMRAVEVMTGRGGWPATVFLTPDLKPFFAGTYFPNKDMFGMPSFKKVLAAVRQAWNQDNAAQNRTSSQVTRLISAMEIPNHPPARNIREDTIDLAVDKLLKSFDTAYGGIGQAPKFPLPQPISLCMRITASSAVQKPGQRQLCLSFITTTLDKMAYGGIHDHIGGGFCRYSTDREWHVPHFEKMLYDNALIAENYLDGYLITGRLYWAQTARDTLDFTLRELRSPEGAFFSSLDADSQGEEGAYYSFTQQELVDALGKQDAHWFGQLFGITVHGNFRANQNIPYLTDSPEAFAHRDGLSLTQFWNKVAPLRQKLLASRNRRPRPNRDGKAIASWNALMVSSLVRGYKVLGDEKYLEAAKHTARFLLSKMYFEHRLHRTWAAGSAKNDACLDDYAFTVQALLDLASADFDPTWLRSAKDLNNTILEHYGDPTSGGFFFTADYQNQPITRTRGSYDSTIPSGTAIQISNLTRLAQITSNSAYRERAERVLRLYNEEMKSNPIVYGSMLNAMDYFLRSRTQIVLVATSDPPKAEAMQATIFGTYAPNTITILSKQLIGSEISDALLQNKKPIAGRPTVYVCHDMACDKPITEPSLLRQKLNQLATAGRL